MSENDRLGPPPVEPLSDLAWSRIERGLWSRMDTTTLVERAPRPKRWMWIAAPALVAAAAAATIAIGVGGEPAQREQSARLVSGAAPTTLSYEDVFVALDAHSAVVMTPAQGAVLERGAAWFTVAPRGERAAFTVTAGDAVVRVVGTKFRVARSGEDATVQVEHGVVEVQFRGARTRVRADEEWTSRAPHAVRPIHVAQIELDPEPARSAPAAPGPAVTAPAAPAAAAPVVPAPAPSVDPKPAARSDQASGIRTAPVTAPAPTPALAVGEPAVEKPATVEQPAAIEKPEAGKPARPDAELARYRRLEQLEVRDPKAAIDGYLELSRGSSRWAEPALFAAARLSADRREPRARHLIEIYLTRFPTGANVDDARKLLDHISGANR